MIKLRLSQICRDNLLFFYTSHQEKAPLRISSLYNIKGVVTRYLFDADKVYEFEMSTPSLKGQSGGPLIDTRGLVCGINTHVASLDFMYNFRKGDERNISETVTMNYQSKFLVGQCLHADIIKKFLKDNGVKFYEG